MHHINPKSAIIHNELRLLAQHLTARSKKKKIDKGLTVE